ncbi:MAG: hypothetical protein MUF16_02300 [Burkholderiaceae bacterium]|jgi:hypothetical protein|nr:hypothetical protein [Burkholderiaceae bacterium]
MAAELQCSPTLVSRYKRAGMPMDSKESAARWKHDNVRPDPRFTRNTEKQDSVAPAARAAVSQFETIDYQEERARRERAEANLAEFKLAELRGELLRREVMERVVGTRAAQIKDSVLQVKARLAPLLAAETDVAKVSAMLDAELRAALDKGAI